MSTIATMLQYAEESFDERVAMILPIPDLRSDPERPPVFRGWEFRAPQHLHVHWDA